MDRNSYKINTKNILIPLLYDYYIFDYFKKLSIQLVNDGFDVTVLSLDDRVLSEFVKLDKRLRIVKGPRIIRLALNRSGSLFFRTLLWLLGWLWGWALKRKYDFVIVPWDNKPLWYIMTKLFTSMSCHNSTEYLDIELTLEHMHLPEKKKNRISHRFLLVMDRIFRGRLLPKVHDEVLDYSGYVIIDRIMGFRSPNYLHGLSGVNYLTVTGERIKKNLHSIGVGNERNSTEIIVTGSPSYEGIIGIKKNFNTQKKLELYSDYNINIENNIYSFFLSPSSFTKAQIDEIEQVVNTIRKHDLSSTFILKFHPKTRKNDPDRFKERLKEFGDGLVIITGFSGDDLNARIILSSKCVLQKQGTVGFIAMLFNIPLVSYDIVETGYYDNMYELIGGSFHCKTKDEILLSLEKISTSEGMAELKKMQRNACDAICYPSDSPCKEISNIIKNHYSVV